MDLLLYTESNSNDEYNIIDLESNLIKGHNYINPNEEYIFDTFSELSIIQIKEEDNLSEEESFPNNNSVKNNSDASIKNSVHFVTSGKLKRGRQVIEVRGLSIYPLTLIICKKKFKFIFLHL